MVAVSSQAAALRAWDVRQNLFAEGLARPATDPAAIAAALAHPGDPLRRPAGSTTPFAVDPQSLPRVPEGGRRAAPRQNRRPPPPDRSALDAAEARLRKLEEDWRREEARLRQRREGLEREEARSRSRHAAARATAERTLAKARADFDGAGSAR